MKLTLSLKCSLLALITLSASYVLAQSGGTRIEAATIQQQQRAAAQYLKAKAQLTSALRYFDEGLKIAEPSAIIDVPRWRNTVIDRIEELERILAPQARATRDGVRFEGDSHLLGDLGEAQR